MEDAPEIYWIHVTPKKRTGEAISLIVTLLLLFLLLILMVGHPGRSRSPHPFVPRPASQSGPGPQTQH